MRKKNTQLKRGAFLAVMVIVLLAAIPVQAAQKDGWSRSGGDWCYYINGKKQTGWEKISGKWFYFNPDGTMITGWKQISGKWYYFEPGGTMAAGWKQISGKWYFFRADGAMTVGWKSFSGKWYYMNRSGIMVTGKQKIDGKSYAFSSSGVWLPNEQSKSEDSKDSLKSGWSESKDGWHYYADGVPVTGWVKIKKHWYYFNAKGIMQTGWHKSNAGNWYYLKEGTGGGMMLTGWQKLSGKWYYFTYSGIWDSVKRSSEERKAQVLAAERLEQCGGTLRKAFNWAAGLPNNGRQPASKNSAGYARWSFINENGYCYGRAAVFYYLALELGYDAHYVEGYVLNAAGGKEEHGWVEIVLNGKTYICDPSFHHQYAKSGKTGYFIQYGQKGTWVYTDYKIAE